ncbi:MAG: magnesium and cobalt transport protein CorA [Ilumatobacteraceae bacterium]
MIVDCAAYVDGERFGFEPSTEALESWRAREDAFVWLGLRMPNAPELSSMCEALSLAGVDADEVLAPHARPVLSVEGPTAQLILRTARYDDASESIVLGEMTLLVGTRSVISIRHGHASPLGPLRARLEREHDRLRDGPPAVVAAIVGTVIDDYGPALDGFEKDAIEVERDVFSETRFQPIRRLYKLKREVRDLLVAIDALQDPLNRLMRVLAPTVTDEVMDDLSEAADQLDRTVVRTQSLSGLLDAALTASLAQISVQQNEDMRKISAWVAMAAVPTLVAGIYGMNFDTFPELHWEFGYPLVLGGMAAIVLLLYRTFKRSGWL